MSNELVWLDHASKAIAKVATVGEAKGMADKAAAIRIFAAKQGWSHEQRGLITVIEIRAMARLGELLKESTVPGGNRRKGQYPTPALPPEITKKQSHVAQLAASVPAKELERYIAKNKSKDTLSVTGLVRIAKEKKRELKERTRLESIKVPKGGWKPDVRTCSMQELLPTLSDLDAIITDPPYPKEFLHVYGELAELAKRCLKPTGILAVMCGQSYLPQILADMSKHMPYRWTIAYLTPGGQAVQLWDRKVNTFWKPVLLFGLAGDDWLGDVAKSEVNDNDKRFHHWGQSESGMRSLVDRLTKPGDLVGDPFLGAGTTGVVSVALGRRFVGCDIEKAHVEAASLRISAEAKNARSEAGTDRVA